MLMVPRADKSKCDNLKTILTRSPQTDFNRPTQMVNLKLNWFMGYYDQMISTSDSQQLADMVDLCLIDADYRKLLLPFVEKADIIHENITLWLTKWKHRQSLLVTYLTTSTNSDLVMVVIAIDMTIDGRLTHAIVDQLITTVNSGIESDQFTSVDRSSATNIMMYLFIHQPAIIIEKLTQRYGQTLSQASEIIAKISSIVPLHYLCTNPHCSFNGISFNDPSLLSFMNRQSINYTISNMVAGESPLLLYFLLQDHDNSDPSNELPENSDYIIKRTIQFNSGLNSNCQVSLFQCFLSKDVSNLELKYYTMAELDEIVYAILFSGISYDEIIGSGGEIMMGVNQILSHNDYWNKLRKRLLRPRISDGESSNMEQYYEVNLYNFLYRCGFPLALNNIFSWQPQNIFAKEISNKQFPTLSYLETKHHSLFEISKYSLDYVYYLSLGRPYQAFVAIVNEYTDVRKPQIISQDIMKEIIKGIHQIALSNIYNQQIIGGCFGLLRLIGSSTESLRCYVTLANWLIDWHVMIKDQSYLMTSDGSQLSTDELHKYYGIKIGKLFKLCLSKVMCERKRSRELLLKHLEELFLYRLTINHYTQLSEIIDSWSFILYFCQLQGFEFSTLLLQFYAKKNEWLLFLCCAQIFGYSKDQVKLAINKFDDMSIRQHMSYIVSKVEDLSSISTGSNNKSKRNSNFNSITKNNPIISPNVTELVLLDLEVKPNYWKVKDNTVSKGKKSNMFSRTILQNAAKDNLIELIFDCSINSSIKDNLLDSQSTIEPMQLNAKKLLAFSLVLNHPFLSVLAFCSENFKPDQKPEDCFENYLNCVSCFILSSFPKRILKEFWNKWDDVAKVEWNEDETIELIVSAIKSRLTNVVADAFFILQPEKYTCISSFFSMISHTVDIWNQVQRELYLVDFIKKCTLLCKNNILPRDKHRSKLHKDSNLVFFNRLLEASLLAAMGSVQKSLGPRFLHEWLESLSATFGGVNKIHVKQIISLDDININLLFDVFTVYFDHIDLDKNCDRSSKSEESFIPIHIKSKEFMVFVDHLIMQLMDVAGNSVDYTRFRLLSDCKKLINRINEAPGFVLLHDKKDLWKTTMETMESKKDNSHLTSNKSMTDLVSLAFAGQNDKDNIVQLCKLTEQHNCLSDESHINQNVVAKAHHGTTNSWRRLVIPEEWQEQIFTISESKQYTQSEVSHVNSLLNEKKWIEACSYMIENEVYVKDALLILLSMNVACGKADPNKLASFITTDSSKTKLSNRINKDGKFKAAVRRLSIFTYSTSKISTISTLNQDSSANRSTRQVNRNSELCLKYLRNVLEVIIHGQEILEYIYTIYCVANKMTESYLIVAKEEEFNVLTKILVGTCREKIDTADMYLGVVDIDQDQLSRFVAEVTVQVLRSELKSNLASTAVSLPRSSSSMSQKDSSVASNGDLDNLQDIRFTISPTSSNSSRRSSNFQIRRHYTLTSYGSSSFSHEYVFKVAQRCQLRPEIANVSFLKGSNESRLMKAFYLQDFLILTPSHRKLGKILFDFYLHFSQEVFSCKEDAEFLVFMLAQCHSCFTEGGDTVGISHCLKSAKELSRMLTANSYFVLLAQLLCRIGRYGEMPYIFTALIEHEHFELLLRKDMDKEGIIVPYILDYLSRYLVDDFEKIELVCHKYNCYYELAENQTKKATSLIKKLRAQSWKTCTKENLKISLSTIISNLLDSCKNYFKVGCYKKVQENLRKAQFHKLQHKWIEDPDKVFTVGLLSTALGKSLKITSNKITFPETSFFGGVRIIDMNSEQATNFLKMIPNFYAAFIIIEQLKLPGDIWIEMIVHHVLINGDEPYILQYLEYFGRVLAPNFLQQCINRLDKLSVKLANKQYANLKLVLVHCNDVFLARRLSDKIQLNK